MVRKSKTDQAGEGAVKFLAPDTVRALRAYLDAIAAPVDGPLFRAVSRWGMAGATAFGDQEVPRIFRKLAVGAEIRTARPHSGHSTRVGAAQDMLAAGLELGEVMQAGSWKSRSPWWRAMASACSLDVAQRGSWRSCRTGPNITVKFV